jgi:Fic family protein
MYKPPYEVTSLMIDTISKIMKWIGHFSLSNELKTQPVLRRKNQVSSIYSSLAIEANQLTEQQVSELMDGNLVLGPKKDVLEVLNAIQVYKEIQSINPFLTKALLETHQRLMEGLIEDAGMFRRGQIGVVKNNKVIFVAPTHERVPTLMNDLFEYLHNKEEHFLIQSSVFHYEFEFIHPFSDGNGRMGRLWQTALLGKHEPIFYYLPIESMIRKQQDDYYQAIALSTQQGTSTAFVEFMLLIILKTVEAVSLEAQNSPTLLSKQALALQQKMEPSVPYRSTELMMMMGLKSRVSFQKYALKPLIDAGFVRIQYPQTKRSRNQRYIKK